VTLKGKKEEHSSLMQVKLWPVRRRNRKYQDYSEALRWTFIFWCL